MDLNTFELLAFFVCSCLFGTLLPICAGTDVITDREIWLLVAVFASVAIGIGSNFCCADAAVQYLKRHTTEVQNKQLEDLKEAHGRRIAALTYEHQVRINQLEASLHAADDKFDRLYHDYEWMNGMYQEQMRNTQEQEDRIAYLETKLQEFGQLTPGARVPFSAPPSRIHFTYPPRRARNDSAMRSAAASSPLNQVVEAEDE
ncbi:Aminopeptidase Y [Neocucurbitaria cava]|uniref:Aminopeptidase Y n=1 Tax=Neocucurbitaria cava TaxID=798079 RepID=A0A9W8XZ34_9PLEO|nr:Aminopeptidase Y [Neocucurbitaria cava]